MGKLASVKQRKKPTAAAPAKTAISAANREAIRVLNEWMKSPPLYDDAFWDDFQRELRENRMTLRKAT